MSRRIKREGKMEQGIWKPYIQKSTKFVQKLVKYLKNLFWKCKGCMYVKMHVCKNVYIITFFDKSSKTVV